MNWETIRKKSSDVIGDTVVIAEKYEIFASIPFSMMIFVSVIALFLNYTEALEAWKQFSSAPLLNSGILFTSAAGFILSALFFFSEALKFIGAEASAISFMVELLPPLVPLIYVCLTITYTIKFVKIFLKYYNNPNDIHNKMDAQHVFAEVLTVVTLTVGLSLGITYISIAGAALGLINALLHEYRHAYHLPKEQPLIKNQEEQGLSIEAKTDKPLYQKLVVSPNQQPEVKDTTKASAYSPQIFHPAAIGEKNIDNFEAEKHHPASIGNVASPQ